MPNEENLFAVTQWMLRAASVFTAAIIVIMIGTAAGIALRVDTKLISAEQIAQFAQQTSDEITRDVAKDLNTRFNLNISPEQLAETVRRVAAGVTRDDVAKIAMTFLIGGAVALIFLLLILRAIFRVVASASVGDPFIAKNAADLVRVAWLLLGIYAIEILTALAIQEFIPASLKEFSTGLPNIDGIPVVGLFTVLLIFVLARIFRRGAEMRAELEGTV